MPEASIYKYRKAEAWKDYVGASAVGLERTAIHVVPEAEGVESLPED